MGWIQFNRRHGDGLINTGTAFDKAWDERYFLVSKEQLSGSIDCEGVPLSWRPFGTYDKGNASSEVIALVKNIRYKPDDERTSDRLLHPRNLKGTSLWQTAIRLYGGNGDKYARKVLRSMSGRMTKVDNLFEFFAKKPRVGSPELEDGLVDVPSSCLSDSQPGSPLGTPAGGLPGAQVSSRPRVPPSLARDATVPSSAGQDVSMPLLMARGTTSDKPSPAIGIDVNGRSFSYEFGPFPIDSGQVWTLENLDQLVEGGVTPLTNYALGQSLKVLTAMGFIGNAVHALEAKLASAREENRKDVHSIAILRRENNRLEGEALCDRRAKKAAYEELAKVKENLAVAECEAARAAKLEMDLASATKDSEKLKAELDAVKQSENDQLILSEREFSLKAIDRADSVDYYRERVEKCNQYLSACGVSISGEDSD